MLWGFAFITSFYLRFLNWSWFFVTLSFLVLHFPCKSRVIRPRCRYIESFGFLNNRTFGILFYLNVLFPILFIIGCCSNNLFLDIFETWLLFLLLDRLNRSNSLFVGGWRYFFTRFSVANLWLIWKFLSRCLGTNQSRLLSSDIDLTQLLHRRGEVFLIIANFDVFLRWVHANDLKIYKFNGLKNIS